jgi:hypothetical protein
LSGQSNVAVDLAIWEFWLILLLIIIHAKQLVAITYIIRSLRVERFHDC